MTRSISQSFYRSNTWKKCRNAYMDSQHHICERCGGLAVICHHKEWLNEDNYINPHIAYGWDNLEALCLDCHNKEHFGSNSIDDELMFDDNGNIIKK
ncbi:HNH endonuclease [Staphylococcus hominis]|uniref:HNH endonuclease n=2 Tax=Staphylococcus hominis TaxID=1290 RepID=A0A3S7GTX1_STAHO|nr:HNH endonuclease [Staphylococcus hominis]MCE4976578.1 HNH endonuclease [Staphylococcus hominis]